MLEKFKNIIWDIKKGYAAYRSVSTPILVRWIKEGKIKRGEVEVWRSGLSGFRRPETLDELKQYFGLWNKEYAPKRLKEEIRRPKKIKDILIIDDEEDLCSLLAKILSEKKYKVITANTARAGISQIKKNSLDLILLDLKLPDVKEIKFLSRIRKDYPEIPVIMVSAYGTEEIKKEAKGLGAYEFIDKPFTAEKILKEIRKVAKQK